MSHWKQARWPFVVFVLIEVVIFGSGSAVTKFAYDSITPLWCLAVRFGLATAVFALFFGNISEQISNKACDSVIFVVFFKLIAEQFEYIFGIGLTADLVCAV